MTLPVDRRTFIALGAAVGTGALVAASCAPSSGLSLNQFMSLSALLTGFAQNELQTQYGATYLGAANTQATAAFSLADLYKLSGLGSASPPTSFDQLVASGFYNNTDAAKLAGTITKMWYSSVYTQQSIGASRATYLQALGWASITWTQANTQCRGATNAWASLPAEPLST